jgi:(p)ppGpp synthase/HD superfamily hydrolase
MFEHYLSFMMKFAMDAHRDRCTKDRFRRFDGKTPFFIHPIGMATQILNDDGVEFSIRAHAAIAALLHDVLEDTSVTEADVRKAHKDWLATASLDETEFEVDVDKVLFTVNRLTSASSAESELKFMAHPEDASDIEVLVRVADIVDNIATFSAIKAFGKISYMRNLAYKVPSKSVNGRRLQHAITVANNASYDWV